MRIAQNGCFLLHLSSVFGGDINFFFWLTPSKNLNRQKNDEQNESPEEDVMKADLFVNDWTQGYLANKGEKPIEQHDVV